VFFLRQKTNTMPTTLELKQKRATLLSGMKAAAEKSEEARAKGESATDSDAEFDRFNAEETELSKRIFQQERLDAMAKEEADKALEERDRKGEKPGGAEESEYRAAFNQWFRHGNNNLSAEERQILASGRVSAETRAQSTSTTAGGYLIAPEYMAELERSMKAYSAVLQVCRIIQTDTGANMPWPTLDATARKAALVAENATTTPTDFTFGQKALDAYMYRDMAAVSLELVQDSAFDINAFISEQFSESFGRGLETAFTTGTGSSQPNGIVTASTIGKTAASATAFTRAEIIDLIHSVDPAYRTSPKAGFMMSDAVLAATKKLALGSGDDRPLWQVSMRDGQPDRLEGFPYWINQDMDTALTTGKKLFLFGDFNKYIARRVQGMILRRLEERFIDSGQIGFIAFQRWDGELLNTAAVKHLKLA
jgi:HK97 family phage major capsid protein